MKLSDEAQHLNEKFDQIKMSDIYSDPTFNCRGALNDAQVLPLKKDVAARGLFTPILLREKPGPNGEPYTVVAGHRRHRAFQMLEAELIPAHVRSLTDEQARGINLVENLERQDLTFLQEATAMIWFKDRKRDPFYLGKELNRSENWVRDRYLLLGMPAEIQDYASDNLIIASDMRPLAKLPTNEQILYGSLLASRRLKGNTGCKLSDVLPRKKPKNEQRQRSKTECNDMADLIRRECMPASDGKLITFKGNSFATKALAWSCGYVDDADLDKALSDFIGHVEDAND